jgi:hypothetical protein
VEAARRGKIKQVSGRRDPKIDLAVELIKEGKARSFAEAARATGALASSVTARCNQEGIKVKKRKASVVERAAEVGEGDREPTPQERELAKKLLAADASRVRVQAEAREAKKKIAELEEDLEKQRSVNDLIEATENAPQPKWLNPPPSKESKHGTLVALFSDAHFGEVVQPSEMNWYNAFNPEIGRKRIRRFFERTILVARQYLAGVNYDGVVVPFLGDTISGDIHDEFRETNELSNFEAVPEVVPCIESGLEMLIEEFGKVHVVSVPGNHPRDSRRPRYKKRSAHNADTLIAKLVAKHFVDEDAITFDIPDGISADFSVYDTKFRIEHGDEASGGGGIQGAMLPIALRTHKIRKQAQAEGKPFDVLLMGHWHQYMSMPAKGFVVNGALKGYDEFARAKGFEPEPPQQALMIVTPEHGISVQAPLFVGKRSDEEW